MHLKRSNDTIASSNAPQALKPHPWVRQSGAKSASSPPRPKNAPRGSKSTTFARGINLSFHLPYLLHNPIGDPSVLRIQYLIYLWLQAAAWEVFGIGGWCVVSCTSMQISKFIVQVSGYAIGYVMVHNSDNQPQPPFQALACSYG